MYRNQLQGGFNFPQEERGSGKQDVLAASSSLCQQDPEACGGNIYSLPHGAGYWCYIHGCHLKFFFTCSSVAAWFFSSPQGRGESSFTALMCPDVAGLGIKQAGPIQGVPVDTSPALGPTTAPHPCPGMENTPTAASLQESKVCTLLVRSCHELSNFSSSGREVPCAFSRSSWHGQSNFCHRVHVVQVRQELAWPLAGDMRQQTPAMCTASLERHSRIIAPGAAVWIQMALSRL